MSPNTTSTLLSDVVDVPRIERSSSGSLCIRRAPRSGKEADWCKEIVAGYDRWRDLVDMKPATRIEIEKGLAPSRAKITGVCRADAIVWHSDNECSIIETKTDCSPTSVAAGIGQLLYYRALVRAYWGVKVDALLLAAPQLPPFILDSIADATAPIRFLKRDEQDNLSGLVPRYG